MAKKTGKKANYIIFGNQEVKTVFDGKEIGVSLDRTTQSHYTMLPQKSGRTKRKWLGKHTGKAVASFWALVEELNNKQTPTTTIIAQQEDISPLYEPTDKMSMDEVVRSNQIKLRKTGKVILTTKESEHIQWLFKELQNPKELARKTGIEEFTEFGKLLAKDTNIPLKDLLKNYLNKKKTVSKTTRQQSKTFFNNFIKAIDCKYVDEITLKDIHNYEDYIYSKGLAAKSIINQICTISTIINYNTGRYHCPHLLQVHSWLQKGIDKPTEDKLYNPKLISVVDFMALYEVAPFKWKLFLLLGLNCAMYPIDISNFQLKHLNIEDGTVAFRRGKTGKVLAVSTLWTITKKLLKQYLKDKKDKSPYVFISRLGIPHSPKGITTAFDKTIRKNAKVSKDVKFNHLRDTFATLAQDAGFSIEQINLVLGHKNKGMNDRYAARQAKQLTSKICNSVEDEFFSSNKIKK